MLAYLEKLEQRKESYMRRYWGKPKSIALRMIWWHFKYLFHPVQKPVSSFTDGQMHILFQPRGGVGDHLFFLKYYFCFLKKMGANVQTAILLEKEDAYLLPLYQSQPFVGQVFIEKTEINYDVHIDITRFPRLVFKDEKRMMHHKMQPLYKYLKMVEQFYCENPLFYQSDFLGRSYSLLHKRTRENQADIHDFLEMRKKEDFYISVSDNMQSVLKKYHLTENGYIILQSGAGKHFKSIKQDTRQWPVSYYNELVKRLKKKYPDLKIIQMGSLNQNGILGVDVSLLGKTSFEEMLVLIKGAKLLISQEGGYPIIRHFVSRKPSCVLFGPTDQNFFGFKENLNLSNRSCAEGCEWIDKNWIKKCVKTGKGSGCMSNLLPETVVKSIENLEYKE